MPYGIDDPTAFVHQVRRDPIWFIDKVYGEKPATPKQEELLRAVATDGITEIYVPSCHSSGKTWACSRLVSWFLTCWPHDSIVLTTAPTWPQVENMIWREIAAAAGRAKVPLGGRLLTTKWDIGPKWYAIGLATDQPVNIQGYHAKHLMVIIDEADGVEGGIWEAIDSLMASGNCLLVAIGNPLDPTSEFKKKHDAALNRYGAKVIRISADDVLPYSSKNKFLLQQAWVDKKLVEWGGPDSPLAMGKIFAQWPDQGPDTLIPMRLLQRAKGREVDRGARGLGVDVARYGRDRTVRTLFEGGMLLWQRVMSGVGVDVVAGATIADALAWHPAVVAVDAVGVGGGVADLVRSRLGDEIMVMDFISNQKPDPTMEEIYVDQAAQWWHQFLKGLEAGKIGFMMNEPDQVDLLINELNRAKVDYDSRGKMKINKLGLPRGKSERGLTEEDLASKSPDMADSAILAYNAALPFAGVRQEAAAIAQASAPIDWYSPGARGIRA